MNRIIQGDSLDILKTLPSESIDMVMTSPPYWQMRNYGVAGQLGLEPHLEDYIQKLGDIFAEAKRVLKPAGTCWVNLGDTYYYATKWTQKEGSQTTRGGNPRGEGIGPKDKQGLPEKTLSLIPFRFTIEMVNRGWILRNTIIWHKPNAIPQSVKDRFTVDFEYLFFFVKSQTYYFEQQREPMAESSKHRLQSGWHGNADRDYLRESPDIFQHYYRKSPAVAELIFKRGRNKRAVWSIPTQPFEEAHYAVYPEKLIETPIKAGSPSNGIVLDPFLGSGTTAVVAQRLHRRWLGIELNGAYIQMAKERIEKSKSSR